MMYCCPDVLLYCCTAVLLGNFLVITLETHPPPKKILTKKMQESLRLQTELLCTSGGAPLQKCTKVKHHPPFLGLG